MLAGILAVTGSKGCLLIVKNYTGDRLNFGLAAERARALGLKVNMVIVDDDIALPDLPQARGVAGTLFVHKIAGALSENGATLEAITDAATKVVKGTASIGMSLDSCTVPGNKKDNRIPEGKAELGLGIHGEPGIEQVDFSGAKNAMTIVAERLAKIIDDGPHVALVNNLGSATPLEMSVIVDELLKSQIGEQIQLVIGPAPLMTSLDMHGFSISLLPVSEEEVNALVEAVGCSAWPGCHEVQSVKIKPLPEGLKTEKPVPSSDLKHSEFIEKCCQLFISVESVLNTLDQKSGDGDTGSTLAIAARALMTSIDDLPQADITQLYHAISQELSTAMGGSSGVLLAIFFAAAGDASASGGEINNSLEAGLKRIKEVGGAQLGDRTMIDALEPALERLPLGLSEAAKAAREGADRTSKIGRAKAGRASYIAEEQLIGNNDPGAEAVALLFEHLASE